MHHAATCIYAFWYDEQKRTSISFQLDGIISTSAWEGFS